MLTQLTKCKLSSTLPHPGKALLIQPAKKMLSRLFEIEEMSSSEDEDACASNSNQSLSLAQKLNAAIDTVETDQTTLIQEKREAACKRTGSI